MIKWNEIKCCLKNSGCQNRKELLPCIKVCPMEAIKKENNRIIISQDDCVNCGACVAICSLKALRLV